jgi:hypothetical protein
MEPTQEDLKLPLFETIWQAIKGCDIKRPNGLISGATGTDVMEILQAIRKDSSAFTPKAGAVGGFYD